MSGKINMKFRKKLAKSYVDQNIHDGEDRSGCDSDCMQFTPDELQELIDEVLEFIDEHE